MHRFHHKFTVAVTACLFGLELGPKPAMAQGYQIDCAILLCLSGGWPASAPCARARAEFIRRITPWPIEPPLQIWRCPMGAQFSAPSTNEMSPQVWDILEKDDAIHHPTLPLKALARLNDAPEFEPSLVKPVQSAPGADIDISGPEFNFVRSIVVYDVSYASQRESGSDRDCNRSFVLRIGRYGTQGDFRWSRGSGPSQLPAAHVGLEDFGKHCPHIYHRSVFVDWRDYSGNYGFEQVNY